MLDDLSYLAGLVDGEACVGVYKNGKPTRTRFVIEIKMTNEGIINWLCENFGGSKQYHRSKNPRWKDQWPWRVQDRRAVALYARLKPLLKIKNDIDLSPLSPKIVRGEDLTKL